MHVVASGTAKCESNEIIIVCVHISFFLFISRHFLMFDLGSVCDERGRRISVVHAVREDILFSLIS